MKKDIRLDRIEDAIEDIRNGKVIIVVDDENRENEGDFVGAAEMVTPEMINFMAKEGRGLICTPITEKRCRDLDLYPMASNNTDHMGTAFTISIDLKGNGVTSGISVADRAKTVRKLISPDANAHDFLRPEHIFPLAAKEGVYYVALDIPKPPLTLRAWQVSTGWSDCRNHERRWHYGSLTTTPKSS